LPEKIKGVFALQQLPIHFVEAALRVPSPLFGGEKKSFN